MQDDPKAYTIPGFCRDHNIPESTYYELRKRGQGPREMRAGRRVLITQEAAADWRAEREHERAREVAQ